MTKEIYERQEKREYKKDFVKEIIIKTDRGKVKTISNDRILELITSLLDNLEHETTWRNDFRMNLMFAETLCNIKRSFFPATLRSVNLNADLEFQKDLGSWYIVQKELMERKDNLEKGIIEEEESENERNKYNKEDIIVFDLK